MSHISEFMIALAKRLVEEKKVGESTADAYVRTLYVLNGKRPFKNLAFLRNVEDIDKQVADYATSTQKNIIATIASVLSICPGPIYKKLYRIYSEKLKEKHTALAEARGDTMEKTPKEKENWVSWEDVEKQREGLKAEVARFASQKAITPAQYERLLMYLVLSLYTCLPPRRNLDYQQMYVTRKWSDKLPTDRNYLDLTGKRFIFNKFKTVKSSGVQTADIPETLMEVIKQYLKFHALGRSKTEFVFLAKPDGSPLTAVNGITRLLNRLFGKRVGSSMLRHSYLSQKYGPVLEEMRADASAMAHDGPTQATYIRGSGDAPALEVLEM
jgi:integrase